MKILFLSLMDFDSISQSGIYTDLLREFVKHNHEIYVISPLEKRNSSETHVISEDNLKILKLKVGNIQKTNIIEKGISTLLIESMLVRAIKKYFSDIKFDLVLYVTPPVTFCKAVKYVKKRDKAKSYLILKDIFPQNAVDLGMLSKTGIKGLIYKYFRKKEKMLYSLSDKIGCLSPANVSFLLSNNCIDKKKLHVSPNTIEIKLIEKVNKLEIRKKYNLPLDKLIFIYGGNLGKPQNIPFVVECLKLNQNLDDRFFVVCGTGTEYIKLKEYVGTYKPANVMIINGLPKDEYDRLLSSCDVGLIFLDHRFTIPNFPSRLLAYMEYSMPVIACTDKNTDLGEIIEKNNFGYWCESDDPRKFKVLIDRVCDHDNLDILGKNARKYLEDEYDVKNSYDIIMREIGEK